MRTIALALCLGAWLASGIASAAGRVYGRVYFVEPDNGATVQSPFKVRFGVEGLRIAPAGDATPGTGHHHLIIDGDPIPQKEGVPSDERHLHFGKGQTKTELALPPGEHTLTLQFADGAHRSYGPELSSSIRVKVAP
ncbi:DUF4399 domain-containing protein [Crenobacter cavernae]|uniref:DUF4399 domain-containing protein n=1 Tax=Crenobacter cavernae TaxID=2290923 RepID=A0A345Y4L6_9NEIS|nr:DUF4399 domain-containing protein [Crenobacter cavernae]AXK38868.1 DUF4399 domain-containing protein [Crenobacter cavernae]